MILSLMRRAQTLIERSIGKAVSKAVMAVPFVIGAGFGAAALSLRLNHEYGAETGNLLMAALFCGIGLIIAGVAATRATSAADDSEKLEERAARNDEAEIAKLEGTSSGLEHVEAGLMTSLAATLVPTLLPQVIRLVQRNLPLVAVISAGAYVLSRPAGDRTRVRPVPEPRFAA